MSKRKPKCEHDDAWELSDLPDGIFASRLRNSAISYHRAAEHLCDAGSEVRAPAYFSACHAIELALKSFLAAKGLKRKDLRGSGGHCLRCLYDRASREDLPDTSPDLAKMVAHLAPYTELYRYPDFEIRQHIGFGEVLVTSSKLLLATEGAVMRAFLHNMSERARYEFDIFRHTDEKR